MTSAPVSILNVVICSHNLTRAVQTFLLDSGVRLSRNATSGEPLVNSLAVEVFVWQTAVKWFRLPHLLQTASFAGQFPYKCGSLPHLEHIACVASWLLPSVVHLRTSVLGSLFSLQLYRCYAALCCCHCQCLVLLMHCFTLMDGFLCRRRL